MRSIQAFYYTDPACPWSWAAEPAWRALERTFGVEHVRASVTPVMAGLAREFGDPGPWIREWIEVAGETEMPLDPRIWLEGPPVGSMPACLAVEAAGEQGRAWPMLRRLRLGLMAGREKLDTTEALVEAARSVAGLDVERFRIDLRSNAIVELLGRDLDRCAAVDPAQHSPGRGRVRLPSVEWKDGAGAVVAAVYGPAPPDAYVEAARRAGWRPGGHRLDPERAVRDHGPLATPEVAALCDLRGPRAAAELWQLAAEWRARPERRLTGWLWWPG